MQTRCFFRRFLRSMFYWVRGKDCVLLIKSNMDANIEADTNALWMPKIYLLFNQVHENAKMKLDLRFLVFVNIYGVINEINFEGLRF